MMVVYLIDFVAVLAQSTDTATSPVSPRSISSDLFLRCQPPTEETKRNDGLERRMGFPTFNRPTIVGCRARRCIHGLRPSALRSRTNIRSCSLVGNFYNRLRLMPCRRRQLSGWSWECVSRVGRQGRGEIGYFDFSQQQRLFFSVLCFRSSVARTILQIHRGFPRRNTNAILRDDGGRTQERKTCGALGV